MNYRKRPYIICIDELSAPLFVSKISGKKKLIQVYSFSEPTVVYNPPPPHTHTHTRKSL
jgi:hypothetical protein